MQYIFDPENQVPSRRTSFSDFYELNEERRRETE
jgi:hypothetical protein